MQELPMFRINHDDPISTAAAALALASALRPDLEPAMRRPSRQAGASDLAALDERMVGARLFESWTLAALRCLLVEVEAEVRSETAEGVTWAPVRFSDGVEEVGPVAVTRRTRQGDTLADLAARLRKLVALIERTETLLAAEHALAGRRHGGLRRPSE
jgi:hypothetical protein